MSTIQNLKNFIRHGKQARAGEPTSGVSPVHAQPQKNHHGISEPNVPQKHHHNQQAAQTGHYSGGEPHYDNRAAQAGAAAAMQAAKGQKMQDSRREAEIQAIVAEEREKAGKLPKYSGLERFVLQEKMGDGAFSNVYRARDTQTNTEVAIKVVRKFEMNSNQVCSSAIRLPAILSLSLLAPPFPLYCTYLELETLPTMASLGRCSPSSGF
jgi:serine/threonine-protein kinase RCK2